MAAFPSIRSFLAAFPAVIWSFDCMRTHPGISGSSYTSFVLPSLTFLPSFRSRKTKKQNTKKKKKSHFCIVKTCLLPHAEPPRPRGAPRAPTHSGHVPPGSEAERPAQGSLPAARGRASSGGAPAAPTAPGSRELPPERGSREPRCFSFSSNFGALPELRHTSSAGRLPPPASRARSCPRHLSCSRAHPRVRATTYGKIKIKNPK